MTALLNVSLIQRKTLNFKRCSRIVPRKMQLSPSRSFRMVLSGFIFGSPNCYYPQMEGLIWRFGIKTPSFLIPVFSLKSVILQCTTLQINISLSPLEHFSTKRLNLPLVSWILTRRLSGLLRVNKNSRLILENLCMT